MSETVLVICPRRPEHFMLVMGALAALHTHHKNVRLIGLVTPATLYLAETPPYLDDT